MHFHYECKARGLDGNVDGNLRLCEMVFGIARNALDGKADGNFMRCIFTTSVIREAWTVRRTVICLCVKSYVAKHEMLWTVRRTVISITKRITFYKRHWKEIVFITEM